jgi:archaetidylinositol phosphate synthase
VLDRYADAVVYAAIIIAGLCNQIWGLAALTGSILVSYTRARAEAAGIKMESVGFAERAERMLILAAISIIAFWWLPALNYGIICYCNFKLTVSSKMLYAHKELKKKNTVKPFNI